MTKVKKIIGKSFGSLKVVGIEIRIRKRKGIDTPIEHAVCTCSNCKSKIVVHPNELEKRRQDGCVNCRKSRRSFLSSPKKDRIGERFGFLEITGFVRKISAGHNAFEALCKCHNCGKQNHEVSFWYLVKTKNPSCGCNQGKMTGEDSSKFTGYKEIMGQYWCWVVRGARERNLPFEISKEYVWDLYERQNRKCAVSGCDIDFSSNRVLHTASVDRIDSSLGYIPGNVQLSHKTVNVIKWNFKQDDFILTCRKVSEYFKSKKENTKTTNEEELILSMWPDRKGGPFWHVWTGYKGITGSFWVSVKNSAKVRGIDFDLKIEDAWDLFLSQGATCYYSGLPLALRKSVLDKEGNASIDRIDSSKGYTLSNICWCDYRVNKSKWKLPVSEFVEWCDMITNFQESKVSKELSVNF